MANFFPACGFEEPAPCGHFNMYFRRRDTKSLVRSFDKVCADCGKVIPKKEFKTLKVLEYV